MTGPDARLSLLCHSYGSVVCARAAANGPSSRAPWPLPSSAPVHRAPLQGKL
ncbi:alpha/beta hydrolase [Streptomyces sp. CRB46]|uniref:alpha/beta hydrolase n=1 Tax=Streptomyces sp. CRB46 TaxID=2682613 RepID=UPI0027DB79BD|nr:alpha/beta hydrolase [Streptomyces sp. CRB46]